MSITEDELVDSYGTGNAKERFDLIYENYSVFPQLVDCFEIGLFNTILNEKEYNRRAKNSADLGVRVQTSNKSDPTAKMAVERVMIREAIERCDTDGGMDCWNKNKEKPRNVKKYLLAALLNAPSTMGAFYQAEVNHDMAYGACEA